MTNGELDKKIEFIIDQQAQFTADIQVMREVYAADTKLVKEQIQKVGAAVITVVGLVGKLSETQERTDARMAESQARTDIRFAELAEAQARTEERLNIFINVVERQLGGNGTKRSEDRS
jgi:hypothetical protein